MGFQKVHRQKDFVEAAERFHFGSLFPLRLSSILCHPRPLRLRTPSQASSNQEILKVSIGPLIILTAKLVLYNTDNYFPVFPPGP